MTGMKKNRRWPFLTYTCDHLLTSAKSKKIYIYNLIIPIDRIWIKMEKNIETTYVQNQAFSIHFHLNYV